jgi:hypothetical protein
METERDAYAAHARAAAIDQNAEEDAIDDREVVAIEPIVDDEFGDDTEWMDVDLPGDSAVSTREKSLLQNMRQQLAVVEMRQCYTCRERGFHVHLPNETTNCRRCQADKLQDGKLWSNANNVYPGMLRLMQHAPSSHLPTVDQPDCLKGLTVIEQMLIARIKPVMHVRFTTGCQLCYKDHIINLPQDITDVARRLARLPQDLDILLIRRQDDDLDRHVDYLFRR